MTLESNLVSFGSLVFWSAVGGLTATILVEIAEFLYKKRRLIKGRLE